MYLSNNNFSLMFLPRFLTVLVCFLFSFAAAGETREVTQKLVNKPGSAGQKYTDTTVIRFDYKQSALYHLYTLVVVDSVVDILKKNDAATVSIDGYAFKTEGSDSICYWISYNRALFLQTYILGRGVDTSRITAIHAWGSTRQDYKNIDGNGLTVVCRAELLVSYPAPPRKPEVFDRDEDGIVDDEDSCPDDFGQADKQGCPDSLAIIVPFPVRESSLYANTYKVLDSVMEVLRENPSYTVTIAGHAYKTEGPKRVCNLLGAERSDMVRKYLISRQLNPARIKTVKNYSNTRPRNAGKTPTDVILNSRAEIFINH